MAREKAHRRMAATAMTPALRHWLWTQFGWDIYDWEPDDIRF
jgi:hypothetical protein